MRSGDSRLRMTTTISVLWPIFIVPGSVVRWTSNSELRNFREWHSCNGDSRLRMTTTKLRLRPTYTVPGSVVRWTSTSELRNFAGSHSCKVGILGFERRQQSRVLDRPLQLLVQLCFGLRRENLEIFADGIRANLNVKWGYTASRDDNNIGSLADLYSSWFSSALDIDE
ncbi:hypothetical protein V1477_004242 [Vespula maculifrons]|uniref:Uncharacterized protein n=1 Tax=Vespula maculifrons TaxID=7453 RepID=A0ABD2CSB6_VESMC